MGDCGRLLPHNDLAGSQSGGAVQRGLYSRHPLYSSWYRGGSTPISLRAGAPVDIGTANAPTLSALSHLLVFFLKTDSLTFGGGLVIVPFLEKDLVQQTGWLNGSEFLVAIAVVMLSPGPVLITATFVGFLVAGFWGSLVSTIEIFLPSLSLIVAVAPILLRHAPTQMSRASSRGPMLLRSTRSSARACRPARSLDDWLTALIAADGLAVLFRWRVSSPRLIAATAVIGLITFPIRQPAWVLVK